MSYILYGDGIHDDYPAIQEMLDSGTSLVYLPTPKHCYMISKTLKIHSNQELRLDRYTHIMLMDNSNCTMLENAEPENWNANITISGGIWDMNHNNQWPNPYHFRNPVDGLLDKEKREASGHKKTNRLYFVSYCGHCFRFNSINGLEVRNLTIRNPVVYGMQLAYVENFTVEGIYFDYFEGSPKLWNLDGVHCDGACKNGIIRNLKGQCHDDMVALTSDDDVLGPIENITIDGIYSEGCHSAVRILSVKTPIKNIHVTNVFGKYYVYCINICKYYSEFPEDRGVFENIVIDNVYASICEGTVDVAGNYEPLIVVEHELKIGNLSLNNIFREESRCATPTIEIRDNTTIRQLIISNAEQINKTDKPITFLSNAAHINKLYLSNINCGNDVMFADNGIVDKSYIEE